MKARILWIEGKRADSPAFVSGLRKKDFIVETVPTGAAALERIHEVDPDLVVINAASLRTNGKRICHSLRDQFDSLPIILINSSDKPVSGDPCANYVLTLPFTLRKLVNRILPLVPFDSDQVIQAGPIQLDISRNKVRCQDRESQLTPRLTKLLKIFMEHSGEVLERESLFREVWATEYTEDTRTLDVHISWLRQAIEQNPRKPVFIKTIRKLGYRLDV